MLLDISSLLAPMLVLVVAQLAALGAFQLIFWSNVRLEIERKPAPVVRIRQNIWALIVGENKTSQCLTAGMVLLAVVGLIILDNGWTDLAPEMIGIAFTVLVVDRFVALINKQREIDRVISLMGARDSNAVALEALEVAKAERWLYDGSLHDKILTGAMLHDAELKKAELQGIRLGQANLKRAKLHEANLQGAYLSSARLQCARLIGAKLQGANLEIANLQKAWLWHAKLQRAVLIGAELQGAELQNAKLQCAVLMTAKLQGANLRHANLETADLTGAEYNGSTIWPDGFDPVAAGCILVNDDEEPIECPEKSQKHDCPVC